MFFRFFLGLLRKNKLHLGLIQLFTQGSNNAIGVGNLRILGFLRLVQYIIQLAKLVGNVLNIRQFIFYSRCFVANFSQLKFLTFQQLIFFRQFNQAGLVSAFARLKFYLQCRNKFGGLTLFRIKSLYEIINARLGLGQGLFHITDYGNFSNGALGRLLEGNLRLL